MVVVDYCGVFVDCVVFAVGFWVFVWVLGVIRFWVLIARRVGYLLLGIYVCLVVISGVWARWFVFWFVSI